jgi:topoisomerase-4 subunit A
MMGDPGQLYLLASDAGYGFVAKFEDLQTKNRAGKAALTLPKGGLVLQPAAITQVENQWVAAVSNEGRLLVFPLADLPQMARGKGNKIIGIPGARVQSREEFVIAVQVLGEGDSLVVHAGKRHHKLKFNDLEHYRGERGRRGNKLPRGFQKVDAMVVERREG